METLGDIYLDAARLLHAYYDAFHSELEVAASEALEDEDRKGLKALETTALNAKVARPLGMALLI